MTSLWGHSLGSKALPLPPGPLVPTRRAGVSPAGPCVTSDVGTRNPLLGAHGFPLPTPPPFNLHDALCLLVPPHTYPAFYSLQRGLPSWSQFSLHASPEQGFSILVTQAKAQRHVSEGGEPPQPDPSLGLCWVLPCLYHPIPPEQHRDDIDHAGQRTGEPTRLLPQGKRVNQKPADWGWEEDEGIRGSSEPGKTPGNFFSPQPKADTDQNTGSNTLGRLNIHPCDHIIPRLEIPCKAITEGTPTVTVQRCPSQQCWQEEKNECPPAGEWDE